MLVAVLSGPTLAAAFSEMEQALPFAEAFELRLDAFEPEELLQIGCFVAKAAVPLIFTFRRKKGISEVERLRQIEAALVHKPSYCDLESDTDPAFMERIAKKFPEIKLIGSYHDFEKTPSDLPALLEEMRHPRFAIYKIAVRANSSLDMLRLMAFAKGNTSRMTCISLGPFGFPSRILGPIVGNVFDYAAVEEEKERLFRPSLKMLWEIYRYPYLNRETDVFALIGDPVEQSPGPIFHNKAFAEQNAIYVAIRLRSNELSSFFSFYAKMFCGLSVTMPLKEAILPFLDQIDATAKAIGAVNTVVWRDKMAIGTNTDAAGALAAIERHFPVRGKRLALLGAGGAARAVAFEALRRGAQVELFNRTPSKREAVAAAFGCAAFPLSELSSRGYDLLINTLPASLTPTIVPSSPVFDLSYFPRETPLLAAAKKRGHLCIYGEEMWVVQAQLQQEFWRTMR